MSCGSKENAAQKGGAEAVQTSVKAPDVELHTAVLTDNIEAVKQHIGFEAFEVIDCTTLAKVQLGIGLIALNAVLAEHHETSQAA